MLPHMFVVRRSASVALLRVMVLVDSPFSVLRGVLPARCHRASRCGELRCREKERDREGRDDNPSVLPPSPLVHGPPAMHDLRSRTETANTRTEPDTTMTERRADRPCMG